MSVSLSGAAAVSAAVLQQFFYRSAAIAYELLL
jgi:hypothetical protein